ncbi:MAG: hypothetical protein ABI548_19810 [Polyangiaceae bacterium]
MSEKDFERSTGHLLFRTLVLMGGALALDCGGSVVVSGNAAGGGGSGAVGGAPQGGASTGGTSPSGGASPVDAGASDCPPAQWDCSALERSQCTYSWVGQGRPEGCVCDSKRPKSVADCRANETLFCLTSNFTDPESWDGTRHVQCTCIPSQTSPFVYEECQQECASTYPVLQAGGMYVVSCAIPQEQTCDAPGNCTATPASVLRQDGVVCGCASIVLK